jgi:hypothetical protein
MSQVRSAAPAVDRPVRPAAPCGGGLGGVAVAAPLTAALLVVAGSLHRYPLARLRAGPP